MKQFIKPFYTSQVSQQKIISNANIWNNSVAKSIVNTYPLPKMGITQYCQQKLTVTWSAADYRKVYLGTAFING